MIIKSFRKRGSGFFGQNVKSWAEAVNNTQNIDDFAKDASRDFLSAFYKNYFPQPPKKILDGGCGLGQHVIAYRRFGYNIIGVDFSAEIIRRIKKEVDENLPVYEADITALPFDDNSFDCYLSNGVIEHFEEGPDAALREAYRVLKRGCLFLVTVPYVNLIRRFYFSIISTKEEGDFFKKRCNKCQQDLQTPRDYNFCEYFFDVNSLIPYFKSNGFLIEKTYPINFLWGDIGMLISKFIKKYREDRIKIMNKVIGKPLEGIDKSIFKKLLYDFLITENRNNLFFCMPITLINYLSGHMLLLVARAI